MKLQTEPKSWDFSIGKGSAYRVTSRALSGDGCLVGKQQLAQLLPIPQRSKADTGQPAAGGAETRQFCQRRENA